MKGGSPHPSPLLLEEKREYDFIVFRFLHRRWRRELWRLVRAERGRIGFSVQIN